MQSPVLVAWLLVASASASGQDPASPKKDVRDVAVISGLVERIDPFTRSVILKTPDGQPHSVLVGRELKTFDELKPGDAVAFHVVRGVTPPPAPAAGRTGRPTVQLRTAENQGPAGTYLSGILPGR